MSKEQKEALLKEIAKMRPEDKAFVMGYCSHAAASAEQAKKQPK